MNRFTGFSEVKFQTALVQDGCRCREEDTCNLPAGGINLFLLVFFTTYLVPPAGDQLKV